MQILDRPFLLSGHVLSRVPNLGRNVGGEGFEVLEQHLTLPEKIHHADDVGQESPCATKTKPIEAMQIAQDVFAEPLYKGLHGVASSVCGDWIVDTHTLQTGNNALSIVVAAMPR